MRKHYTQRTRLKNVFLRAFLNAPAVSFFCMSRGILFHSLAPRTLKVHPPSVMDIPLKPSITASSAITPDQGCALTAPGRLRRLTFSFARLKKSSRSPGRALLLLMHGNLSSGTWVRSTVYKTPSHYISCCIDWPFENLFSSLVLLVKSTVFLCLTQRS